MNAPLVELHHWEWIVMLLGRLTVGLLFVISGHGKLFIPAKRQQMRDTIAKTGLPAPVVVATTVSLIEFVGGGMLVAGLLTPFVALLLAAVMVIALITTDLPGIEAETPIEWLGAALFLPQVYVLVITLWLAVAGPGRASIDALLRWAGGTT
ncbi:MAG: DoxX family protein [Gemmatimonadales bacterium]|nr:DoxX family protein [Gemmatimonadales bacterium]